MRVQLAIGIWSSAFIASLGLGVGCGSSQEEPVRCSDPSDTELSGFAKCSGEIVHRPRIEACENKTPRSGVACVSGGSDQCQNDGDCSAEANGYCTLVSSFEQACQCFYGCVQDSDCGEDQICQCNGVAGECKPASCTQDSDCPGSVCASYDVDYCGGISPGFACVTARDECLSHDDCTDGKSCWYANGKRSCETPTCAIGRPFLVQSEIRVASIRNGSGWRGDELRRDTRAQDLPRPLRAKIASHYLHNGLMEHASIAAFARFSLQLMGLGAPRDLVMQSIAAQADELRHAELCFSVAAQVTDPQGRASRLEPAELNLNSALDASSPEQVLITTILEGCIGETVAAALAEEAALLCADPALRAMHRQIASDEARHAQLAWRSVAWLLSAYPALKPVAARQFSAAAASRHAETPEAPATTARLEAYGVLSRERSAALHNAVLRDVIGPAARAVLAATSELLVGIAAA